MGDNSSPQPTSTRSPNEQHQRVQRTPATVSEGHRTARTISTSAGPRLSPHLALRTRAARSMIVMRPRATSRRFSLASLRRSGLIAGRVAPQGLGHPGQLLLSETSARLVNALPPDGVSVRDVGVYRLKGLRNPERVFQLCHPDLSDSFPRLVSEAEIWTKEYEDGLDVPSVASRPILQIRLGDGEASTESRATWASKSTPEFASEDRGTDEPRVEPIVVVGPGTAAGRFQQLVASDSGKRRSVVLGVCGAAAVLVAGTLIATTRSDGTTTTESSVLRPDRLKPLSVEQRRRPILNPLAMGSGCRRFS